MLARTRVLRERDADLRERRAEVRARLEQPGDGRESFERDGWRERALCGFVGGGVGRKQRRNPVFVLRHGFREAGLPRAVEGLPLLLVEAVTSEDIHSPISC